MCVSPFAPPSLMKSSDRRDSISHPRPARALTVLFVPERTRAIYFLTRFSCSPSGWGFSIRTSIGLRLALPGFPLGISFFNGSVLKNARREPSFWSKQGHQSKNGLNRTAVFGCAWLDPRDFRLFKRAKLLNGHGQSSRVNRSLIFCASIRSFQRGVSFFMRYNMAGVATRTGIPSKKTSWCSRSFEAHKISPQYPEKVENSVGSLIASGQSRLQRIVLNE